MNISRKIKDPTNQPNISRVIKRPDNEVISKEGTKPNGVFRHTVIVTVGTGSNSYSINNNVIDMEFSIPFDNNLEPNEAEITIYNLSKTSYSKYKHNELITVTAGYGNDVGLIFSGRIAKTKTSNSGVDRVTTIYAIDDQNLNDKELQEIAYTAGTKSSYILQDLIKRFKLPIAVFKTRYDLVNKDSVKVDGSLVEAVSTYAKHCGVDVYIQKGKIYAHDVRTASQDINFLISEDTGLIGSPEEYEEKIEEENYTENIFGYNIEMLLQHRIQTGVKVRLASRNAQGVYSVRKGTHSYSGTELKTTIEAIK